MRHLPAIIGMAAALAVCQACREERRSFVPDAGPGDVTPTMATTDVSTFISDSGYTRYHITSPVWEMFEDAADPYWRFPDGLFLEQYDDNMMPAASVRSDSARYFSRMRLWRLDGNVVMVNVDRDSFLTRQLFWDQSRQRVYSDSFIHIVRADRIIEGYGFESNQNMTEYTVRRPTGIIPVNRPQPRKAASDSAAAADTAAASRQRRPPVPESTSWRTARADELNSKPQFVPAPVHTRPRQSN